MTLTGETRYRRGWFGTLILEAQETYTYYDPVDAFGVETREHWRDARTEDLSMIGNAFPSMNARGCTATGKLRFRSARRGKLVLQVEEYYGSEGVTVWRDARVEDLTVGNQIIDAAFKV